VPDTALLAALRRPGDEAQVTQALSAVFQAEPVAAAEFVRLLLPQPSRHSVPDTLVCRAEEAVEEGRLDLRLTQNEWDVIVELKVHAGYGRDQLRRYLSSLRRVPNAYLVAVTRDDPRYGEAGLLDDGRWLGSIRWRHLLPGLRDLPIRRHALQLQWLLFLDVLEREGSMGFMHPDPEMFTALQTVRRAGAHLDDFLKSVQVPLLDALNRSLGVHGPADFYRGRGGRQ
jgi:hypothetical protein